MALNNFFLPQNDRSPEGGLLRWVVNKTGAASVKGEIVTPVAGGWNKVPVNIPIPAGVIYDAGVPDGGLMRIVVSGFAEVYFIGDAVAGNLCRTFITGDAGAVAGRAISEAAPTAPFATDKHFCEMGHVMTSRTGAGLALVNLHFN